MAMQRTDGLDQRAIDADPAGYAEWQKKAAAAGYNYGPAQAETPTTQPSKDGSGMLASAQQSPPVAPPAQAAQPADPKMSAMLQDWYKSYLSSQPKTATANTTAWQPDQNSTVQGQVANITDANGPLMQRAETKALQGVNSRGLLNSSIAVGAGQSALYDAALPIAQQDAGTFAAAGKRNADAADATSQFNANSVNRSTSEQSAAGVSGYQQQAGLLSQASLQGADIAAQAQRQAEDIKSRTALQGADIASQERMQQAGFGQQQALQAADIASQERRQTADLGSRYDLAQMDAQSRAALQAADAANQQKLQAAQAILQTNLATQAQGVQQSMQQYDLAVKQAMQGTDNQTRLQLATLDANTQAALAETNNKYRVQLQSSQSMTASYQSMVDGISRVMVDPNMNAEAKQKAIGNLTTLYNNALGMQSTLTGLNLGQLLDDGAPPANGATPDKTIPESGNAWNRLLNEVSGAPTVQAPDDVPYNVGGS